MPIVINNTMNQIRSIAMGGDDRVQKAGRLAELVRRLGNYPFVGVYDVNPEFALMLAWSGGEAPPNSSFLATEGLPGAAIQQKRALLSGDIRPGPRHPAILDNAVSEIAIPVFAPAGGHVVGLVDVQSDKLNAFSTSDQEMIEQCAQAALPLWLLR